MSKGVERVCCGDGAVRERSFYEDGNVRAECTLVDGLPHGVTRHWHPNGALALEIPMSHGLIDGIVSQWTDARVLLGTSQITRGTGVYRRWHPNGVLACETPMVDGRTTGRERFFWDDGTLIEESFYIENNKVSKKRYREACETDATLPRYEEESTPRPTKATKRRVPKALRLSPAQLDEVPLNLLQGQSVREALSWLSETKQPSRTLGEAMSPDDSLSFIKELYTLGAVAVHAVEIDGTAEKVQNTGRLVIELPVQAARRRKLFKFCGQVARDLGFDPDADTGQRYLLLMLD
jgi:antitoxin component YwqK of YwqJK toxin-antitoxin module